jgi:hypothetical protein
MGTCRLIRINSNLFLENDTDVRYRHWLVCQPLCLCAGGVNMAISTFEPLPGVYPSVPLETRSFSWYGGRIQCRKLLLQRLFRYHRTSRTGTFFEAHRFAKRVLDLHRGAREPYLQSGEEQKIMNAAIIEGQGRRRHSVPFHYKMHAYSRYDSKIVRVCGQGLW